MRINQLIVGSGDTVEASGAHVQGEIVGEFVSNVRDDPSSPLYVQAGATPAEHLG